MAALTWARLALIAVGAGVLAWTLSFLLIGMGHTPLPVPYTVPAIAVIAGATSLAFGWQVRAYLKGDKPGLDPLRAARTAVFAQATAYSGAVLLGVSLGFALVLLPDWGHEPRRDVIVTALIAALGSALMLGAGVLAERWCRHGMDDDDPDPEASPA